MRCKPGDIAVVLHESVHCEANIGRWVVVSGPPIKRKDVGPTWLIAPISRRRWFYEKAGSIVSEQPLSTPVELPDEWLRPLECSDLLYSEEVAVLIEEFEDFEAALVDAVTRISFPLQLGAGRTCRNRPAKSADPSVVDTRPWGTAEEALHNTLAWASFRAQLESSGCTFHLRRPVRDDSEGRPL